MSTTLPTTDASLSPSMTKRVDEVCDRFEAAWKAGQRPRIEDDLGETAGVERSALCHEPLVVELVYRYRQGERPTPEEYWARFPAQVNLVDAEFGVTLRRQAMDDLLHRLDFSCGINPSHLRQAYFRSHIDGKVSLSPRPACQSSSPEAVPTPGRAGRGPGPLGSFPGNQSW